MNMYAYKWTGDVHSEWTDQIIYLLGVQNVESTKSKASNRHLEWEQFPSHIEYF